MKLLIASLFALAALHLPAQTVLPTQFHLLQYDNTTATWDTIYRKDLQYRNGTDWISEETRYQYLGNGAWQDPERIQWTYNADGQVTQKQVEDFTGSSWLVLSLDEWGYDSLGARTTHLRMLWGGSSLDTVSFDRNVYSYNSFGESDSYEGQYWDAFGQQWLVSDRFEFTYNTNQEWDSQVHTRLSGNAWDTVTYNTNYAWADFAARKVSAYEERYYASGQYVATYKFAYDWLPNDGYDEFQFYLNPISGSFDSTVWNHLAYNSNGHQTENLTYDYNNSAWELQQLSLLYDHAYNPDGSLSQSTRRRYLSFPMAYEPDYKWVYSNFITSSSAPEPVLGHVSWAPHPAGMSSSLVIAREMPGRGCLEVYGLQGELLRRYGVVHGGGESRHELRLDLAAGLYVYRLELDGEAVVGKLVVR